MSTSTLSQLLAELAAGVGKIEARCSILRIDPRTIYNFLASSMQGEAYVDEILLTMCPLSEEESVRCTSDIADRHCGKQTVKIDRASVSLHDASEACRGMGIRHPLTLREISRVASGHELTFATTGHLLPLFEGGLNVSFLNLADAETVYVVEEEEDGQHATLYKWYPKIEDSTVVEQQLHVHLDTGVVPVGSAVLLRKQQT